MEMSYCYEKGIPHSVFLQWSPEDRAKTLAFMLHEGEKCSLCGTAPWEWEENRHAYSPVDHRCEGCYRKQAYSESLGKMPMGTTVELVRMTPQMLAQAEQRARKMAKQRKE